MALPYRYRDDRRVSRGLDCQEKSNDVPVSLSQQNGSSKEFVSSERTIEEVAGRSNDGAFPVGYASDGDRVWTPPPPTPFGDWFQPAQRQKADNPSTSFKLQPGSRRKKKSAAEVINKQVVRQSGRGTNESVVRKDIPANPQRKNTSNAKSSKVMPQDDFLSGVDQDPMKGKGHDAEGNVKAAVYDESVLEGIGTMCLIPDAERELNRQEQIDEITALEAIFGEDFVDLEPKGVGSPVFTISIHVETAATVTVSAELPSLSLPPSQGSSATRLPDNMSARDGGSCASTSGRSGSTAMVQEFNVKFLPPICLICTLPPSYPSRSPPSFVLKAWWLTQPSLARLCRALDSVWNTQPGQVVCYAWSAWLQEKCLSHLGFVEKIVLGSSKASDVTRPSNAQVIGESIPVDVVVTRLLKYNDEKHHDQFCRSLHYCNICFSELPGKDFPRLPCQHTFCRTCMGQYCVGLVREGSVNKLICPDTSCKVQLPPFILKELLTESDFKRWEDLTLKRALDAMTDIEYCPRCEMVCIEEEDHHVQCGHCFFSFCSLCRAPWHVVEKCTTPDELLVILQEREGRAQQGEGQRRKEQHLINDILSMRVVNAQSKRCPTCEVAISKTEGCNKMYCTYCLNHFCFICGVHVYNYHHFGQEKCALLDREELERWEAMENHQR